MKKVIFAVAVALLFTAALATGQGMMGGGGYGVWSWLWLGFWVLSLIGLILLVVWLYKKITGKAQDQTPLEILKARYAKGELTKKQFEEMKKELGG